MTTYYLIRHGQKEREPGNPKLTPDGHRQSIITGKYFQHSQIKAIYSSTATRTIETASHIAEFHKLKIITNSELKERLNWGDIPGQSIEDFAKVWQQCDKNRNFTPSGGDSSKRAGERLENTLKAIYKTYTSGNIVIVSHSGIIVDFLFNKFPVKTLTKHNQSFINRQNVMGIPECSITEITLRDNIFTLKGVASTNHLNDFIKSS